MPTARAAQMRAFELKHGLGDSPPTLRHRSSSIASIGPMIAEAAGEAKAAGKGMIRRVRRALSWEGKKGRARRRAAALQSTAPP